MRRITVLLFVAAIVLTVFCKPNADAESSSIRIEIYDQSNKGPIDLYADGRKIGSATFRPAIESSKWANVSDYSGYTFDVTANPESYPTTLSLELKKSSGQFVDEISLNLDEPSSVRVTYDSVDSPGSRRIEF